MLDRLVETMREFRSVRHHLTTPMEHKHLLPRWHRRAGTAAAQRLQKPTHRRDSDSDSPHRTMYIHTRGYTAADRSRPGRVGSQADQDIQGHSAIRLLSGPQTLQSRLQLGNQVSRWLAVIQRLEAVWRAGEAVDLLQDTLFTLFSLVGTQHDRQLGHGAKVA